MNIKNPSPTHTSLHSLRTPSPNQSLSHEMACTSESIDDPVVSCTAAALSLVKQVNELRCVYMFA
jgi:hypothetical protein